MTITERTVERRHEGAKRASAHLDRRLNSAPLAVLAFVLLASGKLSNRTKRSRRDDRGAISVEQFAWIGLGLLLVAGAAAALAIYWGDVSNWITQEWSSITGS